MMNIKNIARKFIIGAISAVIMLFLSYAVTAAPLYDYPITVTQPDGTEIDCFLNGDEYFNYMCDEDGFIVIRNSDTEEYTYALFIDGELAPSDNLIGTVGGLGIASLSTDKITIDDIPSEYISAVSHAKTEAWGNVLDDIQPLSLLTGTYEKNFVGKTVNNLVFFVEFSDTSNKFASNHKSFNYYNGLFNNNSTSMKSYYNEVSYGQTQVNSVFAPTPSNDTVVIYQAPNARYYYESDYNALYSLMNDAVSWAVTNGHIPANVNYDVNGDSVVDGITFVFGGDVQASGMQVFWPKSTLNNLSISAQINGKSIRNFFWVTEWILHGSNTGKMYQRNAAILCHESFHTIFDGKDLYDNNTGPNTYPMGNWDIMCSSPGAHMSSYMKYRYGKWINIPEITTSGTYTLKPLKTSNNAIPGGVINDTVAYMFRSSIPVSGTQDVSQYFIVEYRKYDGNFETSGNLQGNGLVIYRVNTNLDVHGNNEIPADVNGSKYEIEEVYPKSTFMPLKYSNNVSTGITISSVTPNSNGTLSFNVTMPTTKNLLYFKDPRLAETVRGAIGKSASLITSSDITALTNLEIFINYNEIPLDLSGMEYLTGLTSFKAINCKIDNITPLANLTNLVTLQINNNNITNISALSSLNKLTTLKLRGNLINNYAPVSSRYPSITAKDFSLENKDDFIFRISNATATGQLGGLIYASTKIYLPQEMYLRLEKYNSNGELLLKNKAYIYFNVSQIPIYISDEFACGSDGSYVVLSAYERDDERQLLSRIVIKHAFFNLSAFN